MKMKLLKRRCVNTLLWIGLLLFVGVGVQCSSEDDTPEPQPVNIDGNLDDDDQAVSLEGDLQISDFVWQGLNLYYYWQAQVPALADSQFSNSTTYANYINQNPNPDDFFELLLHEDDRFSWISDDYTALQNQLQGISASNGVEFQLSYIRSGSDDLVGIVTHILADSDAVGKNIQRGDTFIGVDGQTLTASNYRSLLYGEDLNYTLNLADYIGGNFVLNGTNVELTKEVDFQKDPIQTSTVLNVGGQRIGYLMYNQFLSSFETDLNEEFATFSSSALDAFVLDLRYNPGGSVSNCARLASMLTGQFNGEIFAQQIWNSKLMDYWEGRDPESLINRFVNTLEDGSALNSLNLNTIYILTTDRSASASELLINGLASHINVIHVGEQTTGKNVGSITVYDYIDNDGTKNPDHTYAMQPIVLKIANSDGFADYAEGLVPDTAVNESLTDLGILGNPNERLLGAAINLITASETSKTFLEAPELLGGKILDPDTARKQQMYLDLTMDLDSFTAVRK